MATTVNNAFAEFMEDMVNLEPEKTKTARSSRDNLIDNIKGFRGDSKFLKCMRIESFGLVLLNVVRRLDLLMI